MEIAEAIHDGIHLGGRGVRRSDVAHVHGVLGEKISASVLDDAVDTIFLHGDLRE
jgi:hypothetical protein